MNQLCLIIIVSIIFIIEIFSENLASTTFPTSNFSICWYIPFFCLFIKKPEGLVLINKTCPSVFYPESVAFFNNYTCFASLGPDFFIENGTLDSLPFCIQFTKTLALVIAIVKGSNCLIKNINKKLSMPHVKI